MLSSSWEVMLMVKAKTNRLTSVAWKENQVVTKISIYQFNKNEQNGIGVVVRCNECRIGSDRRRRQLVTKCFWSLEIIPSKHKYVQLKIQVWVWKTTFVSGLFTELDELLIHDNNRETRVAIQGVWICKIVVAQILVAYWHCRANVRTYLHKYVTLAHDPLFPQLENHSQRGESFYIHTYVNICRLTCQNSGRDKWNFQGHLKVLWIENWDTCISKSLVYPIKTWWTLNLKYVCMHEGTSICT